MIRSPDIILVWGSLGKSEKKRPSSTPHHGRDRAPMVPMVPTQGLTWPYGVIWDNHGINGVYHGLIYMCFFKGMYGIIMVEY